tara:strand:- start:638 stop:826 length:189 start_codon:yes stop_codon:yes gene_type:complete
VLFNIGTTKSPEYVMNSFNTKSGLNPIFNSESTNKERTFKKISSPRKSRGGGILFLSLSAFF